MYLCLTWVSSAERFTRKPPSLPGTEQPRGAAPILSHGRPARSGASQSVRGDTRPLGPQGPALAFRFSSELRGRALLRPFAGGVGGILEDVALAIIWEALMQGGIHGALCNLGSGEKAGT